MIGLVSPPMWFVLYVVSDVSGERFEKVVKDILPFYLPMLFVLFLITIFPNIVLWLPDLVFNWSIRKNSESGALAQAILTAKTEEELKVNLNGVPLTFERLNKNRYIATCSSLSFELVTG